MRGVLGVVALAAMGVASWGSGQVARPDQGGVAPVVATLAAGPGSTVGVLQALQRGEDADMAIAFLDQVTGQTPVACGMTLRGVRGGWGWGSSMVTLSGVSHVEGPDQQLLTWATGNRFDDEVIPPLVEALSHGDPCRREVAAALLGRADRDRAWDALEPLARSANGVTRTAAILALGHVEAPQSLTILHEALAGGETTVRRAAAWALGQLEEAGSVDPLARALGQDQDDGVRANAAWALGQTERSEGINALADALDGDGATPVRINAAWALGRIENEAAIPALTRALSTDADALVRKAAAWALGQVAES